MVTRMAAGLRELLTSWRGRFILVVVASQLLLPLHYYFFRRDPHDERFAWRMFSPMRMVRCEPSFVIDGDKAALGGRFHEAWIELARRGRFRVIEKMGAELCAANPGKEVRVSLSCRGLDGATRDWGGYDMCSVQEL